MLERHMLVDTQSRMCAYLPTALCRFDVYTISRPAHPLALLSYPLVRFYQGRFGADSTRAVQEALRG